MYGYKANIYDSIQICRLRALYQNLMCKNIAKMVIFFTLSINYLVTLPHGAHEA